MGFDQIFVFAIILVVFIALAIDLWSPDAVLLVALAIVSAVGIIDLKQAAEGFGNPTLIALGSLYIIAGALRKSGALEHAGEFVLGKKPRSIQAVLARMCPSVTTYSAFLNNTPIVAMGIPAVRSWAQKNGVPVSKLLIPLSFAAILGGMCTLIGTSTNLIANGLMKSYGFGGLSFFELAWIGVPCAIAGLLYLIFISPILTPSRRDIRHEEETNRKLLVELAVTENASVIGKTVGKVNLENLQGFHLSRINRRDQEIAPVLEDEELQEGDHLLYDAQNGVAANTPVLTDYPGLKLQHRTPRDIKREKRNRELHQVVIKEGSQMAGETIERASLPERYGAAVTGIRRSGKRINQPFGKLKLQPGDVLLLDTGRGFRKAHENSPDFFLTSQEGGEPPEGAEEVSKAPKNAMEVYISVGVLIGIIGLVTADILSIAIAGILGVGVLLAFNIVEAGEARKSIDWTVLLVIGASLGLAKAMSASGAALTVAHWMVDLTSTFGPHAVLAGMVILTGLLANIITNNAAVALVFPIALSVAHSQGMEARGLFIGVTLAASMSFLSPIAYQTNLMVYGPGNYRFTDFFKVGILLQMLLWVIIITMVPMVWPV
jgi:di/tricarboxylate transporter